MSNNEYRMGIPLPMWPSAWRRSSVTDDREPFREAQQQARPPKWWYVPHYNFCCTESLWCVLDTITMCRFRSICDRHDRAITGGWPTDVE